MQTRGPLIIGIVLLLIGAGVCFGAYATYKDGHSGTPGKAKVTSCTGHDSRYDSLVCDGTWVTGGSLGDGGEVAYGQIKNATRDDIGHEVDVRIHGSDHATVPSSRLSIILAALGVPMICLGIYMLLLFTRLSRSRRAKTSGSAAS